MPALVVGLALAAVAALALIGLRHWPLFGPRPGGPDTGQGTTPAQVSLDLRAEGGGRVGTDLVLRFTVENRGGAPVRQLNLRADGPWSDFHVRLVDVDGAFRTDGEAGWFMLGQSVKPGSGRTPVVKIVPRTAGSYHFEFRAYDGSLPLSDASGQPAADVLDVVVGP